MSEFLYKSTFNSPVGGLNIYATEKGIRFLNYSDTTKFNEKEFNIIYQENRHIIQTQKELNEYFLGKRTNFSVRLDIVGTDFQLKVWKCLQQIPYGKTISYLTQSKNIDNPKAIRAVASANGKNPVSIIIPCHRVIGTNGKLVGYAGGLNRKKFLLNLENPLPEFELL